MANHSSILAWRIPMDRGARWAAGQGVAKSWTQLRDWAQHRTVVVLVTQSCLTPSPRGSSVLGILLARILESESESWSVTSYSLWPHGLYSPWNSPGQNTGVGCLSFLQGIFPLQGSNPGLPHYRQTLYQLSYQGSPRILDILYMSKFFSLKNWR